MKYLLNRYSKTCRPGVGILDRLHTHLQIIVKRYGMEHHKMNGLVWVYTLTILMEFKKGYFFHFQYFAKIRSTRLFRYEY